MLKWVRNQGMIVCLSLVVLFGCPFHLNAKHTIDSLLTLLSNTKEDSNKVNLMLQISNSYSSEANTKSITYSKSVLTLSEEIGFEKGKLLACEKLGSIYKNLGEFDSAMFYCDKAVTIAELLGDKITQAKNYNIYGSLLRRQGYYSSALDYHKKSLEISQQIEDSLGIANALLYIAIIHEFQMNYDTAINYYYESIRIYEKLNNKRNIGIALLNIGDLNSSLYEYKKAYKNFNNGLNLFTVLGDIRHLGLSNNKIGGVYTNIGKYDSALVHYQLCKIYYDSIDNISGLAHLSINLGNLYLNWGKYDSAYFYFTTAMNTFQEMGFERGYLNSLLGLGELYTKKGQLDKALETYKTGEEIANQVDPQGLRDIYTNVLRIYKNLENYKKAYEYQSKYFQINDSVFQLDKTRIITDIELKYEKEKDQARILALENENLSKDLSIRKRTNQRNIYLFTGIGIVVIILFLFIFYRQKAIKDHVIANQRIKQLEEEKKLLAAKFLVEGQEEERKRIAKELHDGLGVLLSTTRIQFTNIKDKSPENKAIIDNATKLLEQATGDVRKISHNMMPGLLTRFGLYEATEDLIEHVDETEGLAASCQITGDTKRLSENMEIMLYRILQEMVNNTIKHAKASIISLKLDILPGSIIINYSDNGIGFDNKEKLKLKSIGLNSIQSRVSFLGGEVRIISELGKGVNYEMQIPVV